MYSCFACLYFSEYDIRMLLFGAQLKEWRGGHPKCVQVNTGGKGHHSSCVPTHLRTIALFMFFVLGCLVPTFIKKGVFLYIFESPQKTGIRFS